MNWRNTREYRKWRIAVIRRGKRCVVCGSIKHREAHHLNSAMYFKDERFDVDNGVTLCKHCHLAFHTKYKRTTRQKATKEDFERFLKLIEYIRGLK